MHTNQKIMNMSLYKISLIILVSTYTPLYTATIVYNLRIAEATKRQAAESSYRRPSLAVLVLVSQWSKSRDDIHFSYTGGLLSLQHSKKSFYIRADMAVAHVAQKKDDVKFSRTQTDDILFSGGYSFVLSERARFTLSGLLGIPTHKDLSPEGTQLGIGHVSLGGQLDSAFFYSSNFNHTIFAAARYLRFFPRDITFLIANQNVQFNFNIGNAIDLFIAHASKWGIRNRFEFGYNPTFVFQARICPRLDVFTNRINFIRSSFFANYRYGFLINKKLPSGIGLGISYGFEHIPKDVGLQYVVTAWIGWGINF